MSSSAAPNAAAARACSLVPSGAAARARVLTPTGFVDTIRSGTMVYEERTGKLDRLARGTARNIRTRLWSW